MTKPAQMTPVRVQLKRTKGWRMPANTVKVDRATGYGNPFVIGEVPGIAFARYTTSRVESAAEAVRLFQQLLLANLKLSDATADGLIKLRGKNLACWCAIGTPCHADVLLKFANLPVAAPTPPTVNSGDGTK